MKFVKSISLQEDLEKTFKSEFEETESDKIMRSILNHISQAYYLAFGPSTAKKVDEIYYGGEIKQELSDLLDLVQLAYSHIIDSKKK
ncbi:MAG: hypothetical protein ACI3T9_04670 [Romboutsia timonensis]